MISRIFFGALAGLWTLAGVAALLQGKGDMGAVVLCLLVCVAAAFVMGRRSMGAKARAAARAEARARARAQAASTAGASSQVLVVNAVGTPAAARPAWQGAGADRAVDIAVQALQADELDAGDEVRELMAEETGGEAQPAGDGAMLWSR